MNLSSLTRAVVLALSSAGIAAAQNCAETLYAGTNGGSVGGAVYFTMTLTQNVTFTGLETNYDAVVGSPVGLTMYTTPTTHAGNETNMAVWTQVAVDNGAATSMGLNVPTPITFAAPVMLAAGSYGIALVSAGDGHRYTNGNGTNQSAMSPDGVISLTLGTALNVPFTGTPFNPRVWNGRFCHSGAASPGTNYCGPAVLNSTGNPGEISATGSATVAANNLTLEASSLPLNAFGFFLTSQVQGLVPQPGGSLGVLCLGGSIGRYVGPGQIQNSGAAGSFGLALDLTQTPTPTGTVSVAAGETWNFQAWHRDSVGGVAVSNFTDGLSVLFQ
jgi:hypothetical protein